jgi:hypothetical protein
MAEVLIVGISIGGAILLLATLGLIIIGIMRVSRTGGLSKNEKKSQAEETKMIQDIYHGLTKMEDRVESLETILMERQRKDFHQ